MFTHRRLRAARLRALALVLTGVGLVAVPAADAYVTSDLNWGLTESVQAYGGGTQFHMSQTGVSQYRWVDVPDHTTVISGNACSDGSLLGSAAISSGDTGYHALFSAGAGQCFTIRGRTQSGSGSMSSRTGRSER